MCDVELTLVPFIGYQAVGRCGYRADFGVTEVVGADNFSGIVCLECRAQILAIFGPGGKRTLVDPDNPGDSFFLPVTMGTREEPFRPGGY